MKAEILWKSRWTLRLLTTTGAITIGKHYGAYSCDGCKGFFRRSVRRKHSYTCRHKKNCTVTKDKRNQCRFCRFRKCFRVGMKESAVQKERDKISNRHTTYDPNSSIHSSIDLQKLLQAEAIANCGYAHSTRPHRAIHQNYINITKRSSDLYNEQSNYKELHENNLANINDICESIRTQLIFLIEWAKNLSVFTSLTINDQGLSCDAVGCFPQCLCHPLPALLPDFVLHWDLVCSFPQLVVANSVRSTDPKFNENNLANINDICESIRTQLIFLIEWAKNLSVFTSLTISDQFYTIAVHSSHVYLHYSWSSSPSLALRIPCEGLPCDAVGCFPQCLCHPLLALLPDFFLHCNLVCSLSQWVVANSVWPTNPKYFV
ncbi:unnamed protein product [Schistosoma curassoni]|uniref:Nuclear receptor domain-containing protein n=1 Tax=Schistosoma curassoni TaxID=6186 RepID=A0A183JF28_9TREM|nr:unnamed protein product [Schistosoma curassoni]